MQNLVNYSQYQKHIEELQHSVPVESNWNPGVFIDIDGVVLTGGKPYEFSKEAIHVKPININIYLNI
jgi:ribonucleotide monophosphatase NagD (HAD superfamily)